MIGALISGLFNFILGLVATAIQIIVWPINQIIIAALPDLSTALTEVSSGINALFSMFGWVMDLLPRPLLATLALCFGIRLAVTTFSISTKTLLRVWNVFQKVKFW